MRRIRSGGSAPSIQHVGFDKLEDEIHRASSRIALALIALGLYIAASLLMQHSIDPRYTGIPVLAAAGYTLALWFTFRVASGVAKHER